MPKKKPVSERLAETGTAGLGNQPANHAPPDFARKLINHPDPKEAASMVADHASYQFDASNGAVIEQLKLKQAELDERYASTGERLEQLETAMKNTPRYKKAGGGKEGRIPWAEWYSKDRVQLVVILAFLTMAVGMSWANVYAVLMSSGNVVFLDDHWLAVCLGALAPTASMSIKFITNRMHFDSTRRHFALCVYVLTALAIAAWTVLFADNFSGISGEIDWNALLDSGGESTEKYFLWTQLGAEMLVAASLFLAAEDIWLKYQPDSFLDNSEFLALKRAHDTLVPEHESVGRERAEVHGQLAEILAKREAFINEQVAEYINLRSRSNNL